MRRAFLVAALALPALAPRLALAATGPAVSDTAYDGEDMGATEGSSSNDDSSASSGSGDSEPTTHGYLDPDTPASGSPVDQGGEGSSSD